MEYGVVTSLDKEKFEKEVNAKLAEGYELHGDLVCVHNPKIEKTTYYQAVIKL